MSAHADFYGERTNMDDSDSPKYWDTVPNQFFLVLTNYMGKLKKGIIIDRYTGAQVFNVPLAGYRFDYPKPADYLGSSPEAPNVYRILLTSTLWWADNYVAPDTLTSTFKFESYDESQFQSRSLKMELWLDGPVQFDQNGRIVSSGNVITARSSDDKVIGGSWRMGEGYNVDAWPDYMWIPYGIIKPSSPDQDYVNPEVDVDWVIKYLLKGKGPDNGGWDTAYRWRANAFRSSRLR
jgi:hypothetical protein